MIGLFVFGANVGAQRFFSDLSPEQRQLQTMRTVVLFAVQALGIILILLVIFGKPSNFATVVALAGAGLTVALKDFIVGFFGWFVLMGKDGIRPGDWVEINGVGGEVLEVGLFHTVLLETGNWTDAAHPTGRKITFVNSFRNRGPLHQLLDVRPVALGRGAGAGAKRFGPVSDRRRDSEDCGRGHCDEGKCSKLRTIWSGIPQRQSECIHSTVSQRPAGGQRSDDFSALSDPRERTSRSSRAFVPIPNRIVEAGIFPPHYGLSSARKRFVALMQDAGRNAVYRASR